MAQEEQVLVVETKVIEKIGLFHGLEFDVEKYIKEIFIPGVPRFISRSQAEHDPSYKQLIPYVIMGYDGSFLNYVRGKKAGETRLVGLGSIGIGGHINPVDDMPLFNTDYYETYIAAVAREVDEEVSVETGHSDKIVAMLNDDTNEVGKVHLGIVHYWQLEEPKVSKKEQMITQMSFLTGSQLQEVSNNLETWSQLCLNHLDQIANKKSENS